MVRNSVGTSQRISQKLCEQHGISGLPGKKTECPFCHHKTFSIKHDDTLGKCFHPSCGRFITPYSDSKERHGRIYQVLEEIYGEFHAALLNQKNATGHNAYSYLVQERRIHPQVIADSMLGVVPENYDLDAKFSSLGEAEEAGETDNEAKLIVEVKDKLHRCVDGHSGWLCFFYTDAYHRIVAIRFRQPYSKRCLYFKPFKSAGLFGHGLFRPVSGNGSDPFNDLMIVTEGEFNQLQLQSLLLRHNETTGNSWAYVNACAVGGVDNADYECIKKVAQKPTICYDNDASGAGFQLVEKARTQLTIMAFTTPEPDSDLDDYIRSFGNNHVAAWKGVKELIARRVQYPRHYEAVAKEVYYTRQKQDRKDTRRDFEINTQVAEIIRPDLVDRGTFYHDVQGEYFFLNDDRKLIPIEKDNPDFALLLDNYRINGTETVYRYLVKHLSVKARKDSNRTTIHRLAFFDTPHYIVYLSNHNNQIYRISCDSIDLVDNGTDGVLFLSEPRAEPFTIGEPDHSVSLLNQVLLSKINFSDDILTPNERRILLTVWFYSLFFESIMRTKPILALIGQKRSGKSITLRKIGMLLFGRHFNVMPLPHKVEDFDAAVTNSEFVAIDNADSRCKWLEDRLATAATGGTIEKRVLYTTNRVAKIPVRCFLAITSRTPHFKRDDVADRLLIMKVDRFEDFKSEKSLVEELINSRDAIMTEVVHHIQEVLQALKMQSGQDYTSAFRMADFGDFAMKIAKMAGITSSMEQIFKKLTTEQSAFTLEGDQVFEPLCDWANQNPDKEITHAELCGELTNLVEKRGGVFPFKGKERSFAQSMTHRLPNLAQFLNISKRSTGSRRKLYRYSLKSKESTE